MEIRIYCGLMRQGKTINMAKDVIFKHLIYGRRVISNTPMWYIMPDGHQVNAECYDDPDEYRFHVMRAKGTMVITDELALVFSSAFWHNLGMDFREKFLQAGKDNCDLYGTTQALNDVLAHLRRLTATLYVCKKSFWLIPFPIDFRHNVYNKERGFFDHKGLYWHTPIVFDAIKVDQGWFKSQALLPENREKYILGRRRLYPSEYRRIMKCYDHLYHIKSSQVIKKGGGNFLDYSVFTSYEQYRDELLERKKPPENKISTNNPQTITPSDSPNT